MMLASIVFYVLATVLVASAAMVVTARNPVHSVLFLILAFFNASGLFLLAGAEFLAMILVIVYVGAVAVLFLFVVMMLDIDFDQLREGFQRYAPIGLAIGAVLFTELGLAVAGWTRLGTASVIHAAAAAPAPAGVSNTAALGRLIYTDDILLFQVAGLILLVAMIGAIVLTLRDRRRSRHQDVGQQHRRVPSDTIRLLDLAPNVGIGENGGIRRPDPSRIRERI